MKCNIQNITQHFIWDLGLTTRGGIGPSPRSLEGQSQVPDQKYCDVVYIICLNTGSSISFFKTIQKCMLFPEIKMYPILVLCTCMCTCKSCRTFAKVFSFDCSQREWFNISFLDLLNVLYTNINIISMHLSGKFLLFVQNVGVLFLDRKRIQVSSLA